MNAWAGKILKINLTNSSTTTFATEPYASKYLGGRGIGTRLYWETVRPETKAFDPENRLIFMSGALTGTGAQGSSRLSIIGKSPMCNPEGFCFGNMGGFFGAELKKAGFDGVVIEGSAAKPVYVWINDSEVEIRDAAFLWRQGAYITGELLQEAHGTDVRFVTTGVAGENRVRTAVLFASHESTATGGFGAVMGSKNLKAIAVKGSHNPTVADPVKMRELNAYTVKLNKKDWMHVTPRIAATGHGHLLEVLAKGRCYQCGMECFRGIYRYDKKLEGLRRCQAMEYYLPWTYNHEDEPVETLFDAPRLANDHSICTFELQSMIDWLYACYNSGALTEPETGLPLSQIGTREFLEKLLHIIAYREGFGDILAEGLVRAMEKVPVKAGAMLSPVVAPVGQHDLASPRTFLAHALLYPMEARVHQPVIHEMGGFMRAWAINRKKPNGAEVYREISKAFYGNEEAADFTTYEGKAMAAARVQNRTYIKDSLGLCDPAWPMNYYYQASDQPAAPGQEGGAFTIGDPLLEKKVFTAATGLEGEVVEKAAERICNLQRAIFIREGRKLPEADYPPQFNFTEPVPPPAPGKKVIVPGPGGETTDITGRTLDRDKYAAMLKEFYRIRGWDEETGIPSSVTLHNLDMDDVLPGMGAQRH